MFIENKDIDLYKIESEQNVYSESYYLKSG